MSRTAVFAFLLLSLFAGFAFAATLLWTLHEAMLGRIALQSLLAGLAAAVCAAGLAWLWFRAALQLTREPGAARGPAVRPGAWAAALVGAGAAAVSLLRPGVWPVGAALAALCLLAALPHMGAAATFDGRDGS